MSDRSLSVFIHSHFLPVIFRSGYRSIHRPLIIFNIAGSYSNILSGNTVFGQLFCNMLMGIVIFTCNYYTCGIHIYPMYYSRS